MADLTKEQLESYLKFINKCVENNFNITPEERELLVKIELASSVDPKTKDLIDSLMYEQHETGRQKKIAGYLKNK